MHKDSRITNIHDQFFTGHNILTTGTHFSWLYLIFSELKIILLYVKDALLYDVPSQRMSREGLESVCQWEVEGDNRGIYLEKVLEGCFAICPFLYGCPCQANSVLKLLAKR